MTTRRRRIGTSPSFAAAAAALACGLCLDPAGVAAFAPPTKSSQTSVFEGRRVSSFARNKDPLASIFSDQTTNSNIGRININCINNDIPSNRNIELYASPNSNNDESIIDYSTIKPETDPQRWVQLAYLSLLALLSDWICFSVAASPSTFEAAYPGHSAASLIDIFLFTNVASCFLVRTLCFALWDFV